jgi:hypothetical protein
MYGIGGDDGNISGTENVAKKMQECTFTFHFKECGDGYGHIIHNSFACGKPPIIKACYYRDRLGGLLLEDGKTCIMVDNKPIEQVVAEIRHFAIPENYKIMSENVSKKFKELVDFDLDAENVKKFIERLK